MVELAGHKLKIRLETRLHCLNQVFGFKPMRVLCGDSQRIGINLAIFLARKMFSSPSGQAVDCRDKLERSTRSGEAMTFHQIFGQQQIPDRWNDRDQ